MNTEKAEVLCLSEDPSQCMLQVSGNTIQQIENFRYHGMVFTRDGRRAKRSMHELEKQIQYCVSFIIPWSRNWSFQNPLIFPILTYGHESRVSTKRVLSQVQTAEMDFYEEFTAQRHATQCVDQGKGGVITSPNWLGRTLAWSLMNSQRLLNTTRYCETS